MKQKVSKILMPLYLIVVALLMIILMNLPYVANLNNYYTFVLYTFGGFYEFIISMFAFLHLVLLFGLIVVAMLDICVKNGTLEIKNDKFDLKKLEKIALTVIAGNSLFLLLLVIIFCAVNHVYIGAGVILNAILEILACVAFWLMDDKHVFEQLQNSMNEPKAKEEKDTHSGTDDEAIDGLNEQQFEQQVEKDVETPSSEDLKD